VCASPGPQEWGRRPVGPAAQAPKAAGGDPLLKARRRSPCMASSPKGPLSEEEGGKRRKGRGCPPLGGVLPGKASEGGFRPPGPPLPAARAAPRPRWRPPLGPSLRLCAVARMAGGQGVGQGTHGKERRFLHK